MLHLLVLSFSLFAVSDSNIKVNKNPLELAGISHEWLSEKDQKSLILTLDLKLADQHNAYAEIFKVEFDDSTLIVAEPDVSPLQLESDKYSKGKEKLFFKGNGTLRVSISSDKPIHGELKGKLTYQACTAKYCLLPKKISFPLFLGEKPAPTKTNYSLIFIFMFGLLTAFSPCVFPMVPITMGVLGFTDTSNRLKGFSIGLFYSLGLAITYALIGSIAALSGGFIGQALTNPYIVWGIFIFYILMALALLDVFSFKAPDSMSNLFSRIKVKGIFGAFAAGAIAGIVASPCVGPAVAAILAHVAQTKDPFYGFLALFVYGMGLGSLFIAMGVFYGELSKWMKPGKWMLYTKYLLAGLILLGALLFIKPHVRPLLNQFSSTKTTKDLGAWTAFSEEAYKQALEDKKPIIVDFYADWCSSCKTLDEKIFTQDFFIESSKGIVLLKFDATKPTSKEEDLLANFEVYGLPTILFIDDKGKVQEDLTLTGFEPWEDLRERLNELKTRSKMTLTPRKSD